MWSLFGPAFTARYFGHEVLSRVQGKLTTMPFWYFPATLFRNYWPWMLAVAWAVRERWWRSGRLLRPPLRDVALLGCVWVGCVLLMLSFFPDKKVNYGLPLSSRLRGNVCAIRSIFIFVSSCLRGNVCAICSIFIFCVFVPSWQCLRHPFNIYFLCLRAFVAMFVPSVQYLFFVSSRLRGNVCAINCLIFTPKTAISVKNQNTTILTVNFSRHYCKVIVT